ncbi:MAG: GGDEF domain-containing protein [Lachnospiraceae bacterium]|nr:GGDEF domain-containing protein [Lachnospiraceae bacterium]
MTIRRSMYLTITTMILVPFLLFTFLISHIFDNRLQTVIKDSLETAANAQISEMITFCSNQMHELVLIGNSNIAKDALKGDKAQEVGNYLNEMLRSRVEETDYLETFTLMDSDYQVVACSEENYEEKAKEGFRILVQNMGDQDFYISNVYSSKVDGKKRKVVIAIASIKEDDKLLGYILTEMNLDFYNNVREESEFKEESTFYLLDGNQQIISAGTSKEERDSFITNDEQRADFTKKYTDSLKKNAEEGSFTFVVNGKNYITYYSSIEYTDWRILLTVNVDEYTASRTIYKTLLAFLILLCAIASVWVSYFTANRIMNPIKRISDTLSEIRKTQDYSLRVEKDKPDELGMLSDEINIMIDFIETENLYKTKQQRLLKKQADKDSLTGINNRRKIIDEFQIQRKIIQERGGELVILFIDIDNFKDFNDQYGHNVGDQVLQFFATFLKNETKGTIGRYGGDEFIGIIEDKEVIHNLDWYLQSVIEKLAASFVLRGSGRRLPISCCIGAVRIDFSKIEEEYDSQKLIDMADYAMYQVKNSGKQGYFIKDIPEIIKKEEE